MKEKIIYSKGIKQAGNSRFLSLFILFSYVLAYLFSPYFVHTVSAYVKTADTGVTIAPDDALIQFTSGNHIIGFKENRVYAASIDHALTVEFIKANKVKPQAKSGTVTQGKAPALGKVRYENLWDGITLSYESGQKGILTSTYSIAVGADPGKIMLKYNVPLSLDGRGNLVLRFEKGTMLESAPIAWQEIEGKKVPVAISFKIRGRRQAGFEVAKYDTRYPLIIDPTFSWNTFLGGTVNNVANGVAVDLSENVYVTGYSSGTWGAPVRAYTAGADAFVAKLDSSGALQWNTFLGAGGSDYGESVAVDASGNVYVAGYGSATWGAPVTAYAGGVWDAFVAKLNSSGALQWNTFMGCNGTDLAYGIALDASNNIYVTGYSNGTWGTPVAAYSAGTDVFAAKLNNSGALQWNTFMGGAGNDYGYAIAVDTSNNVYITGYSSSTWGTPVTAFGGANDAFAAKLNSSGALQWSTFMGGAGNDYGRGIVVDTSGNVYVAGYSSATWGTPLTAFGGGVDDAFTAKLNSSGALQWNTFTGANGDIEAYGMAIDANGGIYIVGYSNVTWGSPITAYSAGYDAFTAKLDSSGALQWNSFLGGASTDYGYGIAVATGGNVYSVGRSNATWGSPIAAYAGLPTDAFAAKISNPIPITSTATAVPTFNQRGMIIFIALMGLVSVYYLRRFDNSDI
ncbi:MAG: SBBP repeat-containing protein [Candidatus Magnetominusculus sp. LBB02]|nr:SBBP repeat-containing protein [Candidatus Magnetominusculus sp. LBB02]